MDLKVIWSMNLMLCVPSSGCTFVMRLQMPYNTVRYEMTGSVNSLGYFLVNEVTGEVFIKRPLSEDRQDVDDYVVNVRAYDLGVPSQVSESSATITIRVQRNKNCPQFEGEPFRKSLDQTQGIDSEVMKITAVDYDAQVRHHNVCHLYSTIWSPYDED